MGLQNKCTQNTSLKASDVDYLTEQDIFREKKWLSLRQPFNCPSCTHFQMIVNSLNTSSHPRFHHISHPI